MISFVAAAFLPSLTHQLWAPQANVDDLSGPASSVYDAPEGGSGTSGSAPVLEGESEQQHTAGTEREAEPLERRLEGADSIRGGDRPSGKQP